MYYLYIIRSLSSNIYYIGISSDYMARLKLHNNSVFDKFTSKHRPWEFAAVFQVNGDKKDALKIEKFIKKQKSRTFIEKIISTTEPLSGILAQLVRISDC